ncbi:MAG: SDR family NAD(P)-dependent oxidoreductase [Proteobacteria bacterium]|nr:SDR family NAD(P)-dependent oxidoreductase [Pseudomonadota bacterium]MBU4469009.1 SDR family NAD(P)-dependent oxidoreductase [Pseudomonadota bacterium]MCG2750948.1 SDR family NAD(P)-dependent oxidoreductase [Desulfobacteraceae bacterium]
MNLTGNTILITGGTSGLGFGFAERFLHLGNRVIVCGRRVDRLDKLRNKYPEINIIQCDMMDAAQRESLAKQVMRDFPETNILVNNAGIQLHTDLTKPVELESLRAEIETNLIAPIHLGSIFAEHLSSRNPSAIINITSGLAFAPSAFVPVYCATKAAMHSLTLSLRYQLRNTPTKVFEIAPPAVDTELGYQHRPDPSKSHGGIPISQFLDEAILALESDLFEAPIGMAKGLHEKREALFDFMNR